jgi:hypothetical protein
MRTETGKEEAQFLYAVNLGPGETLCFTSARILRETKYFIFTQPVTGRFGFHKKLKKSAPYAQVYLGRSKAEAVERYIKFCEGRVKDGLRELESALHLVDFFNSKEKKAREMALSLAEGELL